MPRHVIAYMIIWSTDLIDYDVGKASIWHRTSKLQHAASCMLQIQMAVISINYTTKICSVLKVRICFRRKQRWINHQHAVYKTIALELMLIELIIMLNYRYAHLAVYIYIYITFSTLWFKYYELVNQCSHIKKVLYSYTFSIRSLRLLAYVQTFLCSLLSDF